MTHTGWYLVAGTLLFAAAAGVGWSLTSRGTVKTEKRLGAQTAGPLDAVAPIRPAGIPSPRPGTDAWAEVNPRSPGYDAIRAGQLMDLPVRTLYEREPRDARWASAMESAQAELLARNLQEVFGDGHVDEIDCRTATCRTVISIDARNLKPMLDFVQVFLPIGEAVSFDILDDGPELAHVAWLVAFSPAYRTLDALDAQMLQLQPNREEMRRAWIESQRAAGTIK